MEAEQPDSNVRNMTSHEEFKKRARYADSVTSDLTLKEEDVEEIVRDMPLPLARPRLDPALYTKGNLRISDEEREEPSSGRIQTAHAVPDWFPKRIKKIFLVDRNGGQLTFRELDRITKYRNALERVKRRKWKIYIEAGRNRWQLQRYLRRIRSIAHTMPNLSKYRKAQFEEWENKALKKWNRLEKLHLGLRVLDEVIDLNFRQERVIYEKKLGGRLCD